MEEDYMTKEWILRKWNKSSDSAYQKIMASKLKAEQKKKETNKEMDEDDKLSATEFYDKYAEDSSEDVSIPVKSKKKKGKKSEDSE